MDASDTKWHYVHDPSWRIIAKFEDDNDDPTEQYLYHQAGLDGSGNSSYIDAVVLRQRDTDANGTLEEHLYYCQNWRQDVVAIVTSGGAMQDWVKYSSYGIPFAFPAATLHDERNTLADVVGEGAFDLLCGGLASRSGRSSDNQRNW